MRVLLVGRGGREHALAWKLTQSPLLRRLFLWPGSPTLAPFGEPLPVANDASYQEVVDASLAMGIQLVVVGPEGPLADGLSDLLEVRGIRTFGPVRGAARLEADKAFAKEIMHRAGIPTAASHVVETEDACRERALAMLGATGGVVLKASGLAAGKGVFVCFSPDDIREGLRHLYHTEMRKAASQVVVEEVLKGRECSYFTFLAKAARRSDGGGTSTSGPTSLGLGFAVDHKRLEDGDRGPNTGGMGCYAPVPWLPLDAAEQVESRVVEPLLRVLETEGIPYHGCLYVGLMWSPERGPQVVEFNVRLGDLEAQVLAAVDDRDWLLMMAQACGVVSPASSGVKMGGDQNPSQYAVAVVMAGQTYPFGEGVEQPVALPRALFARPHEGAPLVFGAGVEAIDHDPDHVRTGSGRVLAVAARGASFAEARDEAYQRVAAIKEAWPGARYRRDIARDL